MTKTPTVAGLKRWARANKALAMTVLKATAFAEVERERVDAYIEPMFRSYGFVDEDGAPITESKRLYHSEDEATVKEFYAECLRLHAVHGYTAGDETCPALVAESLKIEAENLLLASLAAFSGVPSTMDTYTFSSSHGGPLETRKWALEMALTACLGKLV